MGVIIGGVDVVQIVKNEFRIEVLDIILKWLIENNPDIKKPSGDDISQINKNVYDKLKIKYPNLIIELKEK